MNERELQQTLQTIATKDIPEIDRLPQIRQSILARQPRPQYPKRKAIRLLKAAAMLIPLVLTSIIALAVVQGVRTDPGLQSVDERGLVETLNLSQTIDGITVTIERAYADQNRISVWYRVDGLGIPEGYRLQGTLFQPGVSLENTNIRPMDPDMLWPVPGGWDPTTGEGLAHIDTQRALRDLLEDDIVTFGFGFDFGEHFDQPLYLIPVDERFRWDEIPDEYIWDFPFDEVFMFELELPLHERLRIYPDKNAEVTVNDITMGINPISLSPSQIDMFLCYQSPDSRYWVPGELTVRIDEDDYPIRIDFHMSYGQPHMQPRTLRCIEQNLHIPYDGTQDNLTVIVNGLKTLKNGDIDGLVSEANRNLEPYGIRVEPHEHISYNIVEWPEDMRWSEIVRLVEAELLAFYEGTWTIEIPILQD